MNDEQEVIEAPDASFSAEQTEKINQIIQDRLARQARKHFEEREALRIEAAEKIRAATGEVNADTFVEKQMLQRQKDAAELERLTVLFSDTKWSQETIKANPALWRKLRDRRDELKFGPPPKVVMRERGFRTKDTY